MKNIKLALILLIIASSFNVYSQSCPVPNGSFETWEDVTEEFDENGVLPAGTIMLPEGYLGLFRLFFSVFDELFAIFGESVEFIEASSKFFGLYQSMDATEGNYSLQLQADDQVPFLDVLTVFECPGDLPLSFNLDIKHLGDSPDTLTIWGSFSDSEEIVLDESQLQDARGYILVENLVLEGDTEWQTYSYPVVDNMNGISPDSVMLFLIMSSVEDSIAAGVESSFLVDNFTFGLEGALALSVKSFHGSFEKDHNRLTWSILNEHNISHYIVERSHDNITDWEAIHEISVQEMTTEDYRFLDTDITKRGDFYYRIKQVDLDGTVSISDIIHILVPSIEKLSLQVYPNPTAQYLNLELYLNEDGDELTYTLLSVDGVRHELRTDLPRNLGTGSHNLNLDVSNLPAGFYQLIVSNSLAKAQKKIVISK